MADRKRKHTNRFERAIGYYPYWHKKMCIAARKLPLDYLWTSMKRERRKSP